MNLNYRTQSTTHTKNTGRTVLTPASSLSSVASSKSSTNSSTPTSRSCSSTNLSLFTTDSCGQINADNKINRVAKNNCTKSNSMGVNPVITRHTSNHLLSSNRLNRSTSTEQLNPIRFVAHNCLLKCMCLGQTSGEVFASVGNDNQIKLWAIGNTQSLMTLKGRTAIECVEFSRNEEMLATGSLKGSVQIWDLNAKNLIRTFRGHTSTIKSLDFFPSGDFLTSGSADCTVKLWDSRKNDCVHTYDEHEKPITCQVFSPDGKWLASADCESIKLWDLTACKKLADLKAHTGAITDIKFHPQVLLMASSSVDGTICFWELENFKLISRVSVNTGNSSAVSSGYITSSSCSSNRSISLNNRLNDKMNENQNSFNNAIHKIIFHPNGYQLFATAKDKYLLCDVYDEPELNSVVNLNFGIGRDLAFNKSGAIIGSHQQTYVSLQQIKWSDLDHYDKFGKLPMDRQASANRNLFSSKYNDDLKSDPEDNDLLKEVQFKEPPFISPNENTQLAFSSKHELPRTPTMQLEDCDTSAVDRTYTITCKSVEQFEKQILSLKKKAQSINDSLKLPAIQNCVRPQPDQSACHLIVNNNQQGSTMVPMNNNKINQKQPNQVNRMRSVPKSVSMKNLNKVAAVVQPVQNQSNNNRTDFITSPSFKKKITPSAVVYPDTHHPFGHLKHQHNNHIEHYDKAYHLNNSLSINNLSSAMNLSSFKDRTILPNHLQSNVNLSINSNQQNHSLSMGNLSRKIDDLDDEENEIIEELLASHFEMKQWLSQRDINLKLALDSWQTDRDKAFKIAHSTQDMIILGELIKLSLCDKSDWNIQTCQKILPHIDAVLRSKLKGPLEKGYDALEFILENFLDLIKQNITKHPNIGIDLEREERYKKSKDCHSQLVSLRTFVNDHQDPNDQLALQFKRLSSLLERIDVK